MNGRDPLLHSGEAFSLPNSTDCCNLYRARTLISPTSSKVTSGRPRSFKNQRSLTRVLPSVYGARKSWWESSQQRPKKACLWANAGPLSAGGSWRLPLGKPTRFRLAIPACSKSQSRVQEYNVRERLRGQKRRDGFMGGRARTLYVEDRFRGPTGQRPVLKAWWMDHISGHRL